MHAYSPAGARKRMATRALRQAAESSAIGAARENFTGIGNLHASGYAKGVLSDPVLIFVGVMRD
jgi:hypothetical protein